MPPARWWPIFRRDRAAGGDLRFALVYIALTLLSKRQPAAVAEQEP